MLQRTAFSAEENLSEQTGKPLATIRKDTDRDNFMSAEEARDYGLVDHVVETLATNGKTSA